MGCAVRESGPGVFDWVRRTAWDVRSGLAFWVTILLWLFLGYAVCLRLIGGMGQAALAQAAVCVAAAIPLLGAVLRVTAAPKRLWRRLPKAGVVAVGLAIGSAQFILPWLGWSALVWAMNRPGADWGVALRSGAGVAGFSYLTAFLMLWRLRSGAEYVQVSRWEIPVARLPDAFDGYQLLLVSDLHVGRFAPPQEARARLAQASELRPDLLVFAGDLADKHPHHIAGAAQALASLQARDGTVAVLGNHDVWVGEGEVRSALESVGARVLVNSHLTLTRNDSKLYVAGVGDASYTDRDDLPRAFDGIPEGACVILLSHTPEIIARPGWERASVVLSGHTHGGQVVLPGIGPLFVPAARELGRRRARGLHRIRSGWVFVSGGLGEVFPPLRIACPPEIVLLTLRRAP